MSEIPILVISLQRAHERRRLMRAQLELPGMPPYRFLDALDARAAGAERLAGLADRAASLRHIGRQLTATEIACAHSHLQAYEHILASRLPAAIVLEDDVLLSCQFTTVVGRVLPMIDPTQRQVVLLSHMDRYSAWGGRPVDRLRTLYPVYEAYGAHAYLITASAAKSMLERLRPLHTMADDWRYFAMAGVTEVRGLVPYLVGTSPLANDSQIGSERFSLHTAHRVPAWVRKYVWQRLFFQIAVKPILRLRRDKKTW